MTRNRIFSVLLVVALSAGAYAAESKGDPALDKLMAKAKDEKNYQPLFKKNLSGATLLKGLWEFEDGVLAPSAKASELLKAKAPPVAKGAAKGAAKGKAKAKRPRPMRDIWTKKRFGDFILDLEFKCEEKTNSGVFVRCDDIKQWLHTGIEIQIMQNKSAKSGRNDTGAVYDCLAPTKVPIKKAGEWNRYTIICNDNWIHVILNGERITDMNLDLWTAAHKNPDGSKNKFNNAYKEMKREGHIGLQYHGHPVWFRNLRIKSLKRK